MGFDLRLRFGLKLGGRFGPGSGFEHFRVEGFRGLVYIYMYILYIYDMCVCVFTKLCQLFACDWFSCREWWALIPLAFRVPRGCQAVVGIRRSE